MSILKKAPEGVEVLDLAPIRAARAEALTGQPLRVIKLEAGYVGVKAELDVMSADDFAAGHIKAGLAKLLADPADVDVLVKDGLTKDDLNTIVEFVTGNSLGE